MSDKCMIDKPKVSIIIPTFNRAYLLARAIESVLAQTYKDFEIVVIDDASTDNTKEVVKSFDDKNIQYIYHKKNMGGAAARNTGIKIARGYYIAFLDDDDEWLGNKLEKQVEAMKKLPCDTWGGIYCGFYNIIDGKVTMVEASKKGDLKKEILNMEVDIGASSTLLFSKEAIMKIGFFDESFERHQDWEYLIRFFRKYKLFCLKEPLVKVYGRRDSIPSGEKMARVKYKYLYKYKEDIYGFGDMMAKEIFAKHWLEIAMTFAVEGKTRKCVYYLKKSLRYKIFSPKVYCLIPFIITKNMIFKKRVNENN